MSTKDVSRFLFQPRKHYATARLQQGRSLLDSDYNEGAALDAEEWRRAVLDAVGPRGTPDEGFSLGQSLVATGVGNNPLAQTLPLRQGDSLTGPTDVSIGDSDGVPVVPVSIRLGTYYLGGMRLALDRPESIMFQRDFLQMTADDLVPATSGTPALYYLEAWEQAVTAVEDEELLDRALGGPDTMVRVRRMRQVKLLELNPEHTTCREAFEQLIPTIEQDGLATFNCNSSELESNGRLQLVFQAGSDGDPCTPDPPAQYLGTENETLRIMLADPVHFVWGFDNAAPLYRVNLPGLMATSGDQVITDPTHLPVELLTPAKDIEHQPTPDRVIEFLPFAALIDGSSPPPGDASRHYGKAAAEIGVFARVKTGLGPDGITFTVDASDVIGDLRALITRWSDQHPFFTQLDPLASTNPARSMYVRFWHMATGDTPVLIPTDSNPNGTPLADTGIIPVFHAPGLRGDFWSAALRPDTPQRIVPFDLLTNEQGVAPLGPRHFFAPLAVAQVDLLSGDPFFDDEGNIEGTGGFFFNVGTVHDCRSRMRRLVDAGCTTFTVGDGLHTVGDFTSIQAAIDALPVAGGRVSILPGFYKQAFQIANRTNVSVEGCGDDTVIETPASPTLPGTATIDSSDHVSISNLRFHAVEQPAVYVHEVAVGHVASHDIALSGLSVQAFVPAGAGVTPGGGAGTAGLIELHDTSQATLSGLLLQAARRPAVRMESANGADDVTLTDISALGTDDTTIAPTAAGAALILMRGMQRVIIRRTSLQTFGQVGVLTVPPLSAVTPFNTDVTMSALTIVAGSHPTLEAQPAIDVNTGVRVTVEDSDISMPLSASNQAAVVLVGDGVILRRNSIVAETGRGNPAWGGIHVRGLSNDVEIRDNDVRGGFGHGITIGSVLWGNDGHREAVGAGQVTINIVGANVVTGDLSGGLSGGTVLPFDEGPINNLTIAGNHITGFGTNGISALTVLGLAASGDTELMDVEGLRIERNEIRGNVRVPFDDVPVRSDFLPFPAAAPVVGIATPIDLRVLPVGGVVLASVTGGLAIVGNTIEQNGDSATIPTNGIFVLTAQGIEIVQNKISRNGGVASPDSGDLDNTPGAGVRAGIAVMLAGNEPQQTTDGILALLDIDPTVTPSVSNSSALALRVYQNSVQQPEGRALHAVAIGSVAIDGNFLSSQGFHGAATTEDAFAVGDVVFVQNLGAPWEIVDAHELFDSTTESFPGFTTPPGARAILVNNPPGSPRRFVGAGGGVLFTNNQVILDWDVKRPVPTVEASIDPPLSYFAVTILTLDHLCCVGNNFALRLGGVEPGSTNPPIVAASPELEADLTEPLLANAFLGGSTVQVARNRFAENVLASALSLISGAELMNMTAGNQGTHAMFAYEWWVGVNGESTDFFMSRNNTAMFLKHSIDYAHLRSILRDQAKAFFTLLQEPTT